MLSALERSFSVLALGSWSIAEKTPKICQLYVVLRALNQAFSRAGRCVVWHRFVDFHILVLYYTYMLLFVVLGILILFRYGRNCFYGMNSGKGYLNYYRREFVRIKYFWRFEPISITTYEFLLSKKWEMQARYRKCEYCKKNGFFIIYYKTLKHAS